MRGSKLFLILIVSMVLSTYGASSSTDSSAPSGAMTPVSSLENKVLLTLIPHPGRIAQGYQRLPEYLQTWLFKESVNHALQKQLGLRVLISKPDISLQELPVEGDFVGFSPDGEQIALGVFINGRTYTRIVNVQTAEQVCEVEGFFSRFSPDGRQIALDVFINGRNNTRIVNAQTGKLIKTFEGNFGGFSPDGKQIALDVSGNGRNYTRIVNVQTDATVYEAGGFFSRFSPDGELIALRGSISGRIYMRIINVQTAKTVFEAEGIFFKDFSPDGKLIALVKIVNERSYTRIVDIQTAKQIYEAQGLFGGFSPDGKLIALSMRNTERGQAEYDTRIVNAQTAKPVYKKVQGFFRGFSPDGTFFVVSNGVGAEARVSIVNTQPGQLIKTFNGTNIRFSPDGSIVATSQGNNTVLKKIDFRDDLANITDLSQRIFLLQAAQDWLEGKPHPVEAHNASYRSVIEQIPYLNNLLLFDVLSTTQSIYEDVRDPLPMPSASSSSVGPVIEGSSSGENEQVRAPDEPRTM